MILTLNLWNTQPPLEYRMGELRRFLATVHPDIVLFQEVAFIDGSAQIEPVFSNLSYMMHCVPVGTWKGQNEGLAICTRRKSIQVAFKKLSQAPNEIERAALVVETTAPNGSPVFAMTTHLACRHEHEMYRLRQAAESIELLLGAAGRRGAGVLVGGDLNDDDGVVRNLFLDPYLGLHDLRKVTSRSDESPTVAWDNPWASPQVECGHTFDYLFGSSAFGVDWCSVALCGHDGWGPVSDHYGVLARVRMKTQ